MDRPLIYVVDDDDAIREVVMEALTEVGYSVNGFRNGLDAAIALTASPVPDLILLDWMMPIMNGEEFIRLESENIKQEKIPVVVISAITDRLQQGPLVKELVQKPFNLDQLFGVVCRNCGPSDIPTESIAQAQ